jgi:hypothetical protein
MALRCTGPTVTENSVNGKIKHESPLYPSSNYWAPLTEDNDIEDNISTLETASAGNSNAEHALTLAQPGLTDTFERWLHQRCGIKW